MYRNSYLKICMLYLVTVSVLAALPVQAQRLSPQDRMQPRRPGYLCPPAQMLPAQPLALWPQGKSQSAQTRIRPMPAPKVILKNGYTKNPNQTHLKDAEALLKKVLTAPYGPTLFQAMDEVVQVYKQSQPADQYAIAYLCVQYMQDKNRNVVQRWPFEYVLSLSECEAAIPNLINELLNDNVEVMRAVAAEALGFWYESSKNAVIYNALMQSADVETSMWVRVTLANHIGFWVTDPGPAPEDVHLRAADGILQEIRSAQPGFAKFQAIDAAVSACNQSGEQIRYAIAFQCIRYMVDRKRPLPDRWPCIYVLTRAQYEPALPCLFEQLVYEEETMRAVAAEGLGAWYTSTGNDVIRTQLVRLARVERNPRVLQVLARYLGSDMPSRNGGSSQ